MIDFDKYYIRVDYQIANEGVISGIMKRIKGGKKKESTKEPVSRKGWNDLSPEEQKEFNSKILPIIKKMTAKAKGSIGSNKVYGAKVSSMYLNIDKNIEDVYDEYTRGAMYIVAGDDWDYAVAVSKSDSNYAQYKNSPSDLLDKMYADQHSEVFMKQAKVFDDMRKALPAGWTMVNDGDKYEWWLGIKHGEPNKSDMESIKWYEKVLKT